MDLQEEQAARFAAFDCDSPYSDYLLVTDVFPEDAHDAMWRTVYSMLQMQVDESIPRHLRHLVAFSREDIDGEGGPTVKITWEYRPLSVVAAEA